MTLKSMTGFARAEGASGALSWAWELRSVNGRNLDVRLKLPPGFEVLEPLARDLVQRQLHRGSVTLGLVVNRSQDEAMVRLNTVTLDCVIAAAEEVRRRTGGDMPSVGELLAIRGVLETVEALESEDEAERRARLMLASLDQAIGSLIAARSAEGERLASILAGQLDAISATCASIAYSPARSAAAVSARFSEQVGRLLAQVGGTLDPVRLHQEAALLATKGDIEEELQRLDAHVSAARGLIASAAPVGRKLDFLCQEFNREANTVCSKSNDMGITRAGLELKHLIDQMREQIQNIE